MVDKEHIVAVAQEGLDLLRKEGWTQGRYGSDFDGRCYYGAVATAADRIEQQLGYTDFAFTDAVDALVNDATDRVGKRNAAGLVEHGVIDWNDATGRTQQEVEALLQEQIDHFKENGASA